MFPLYLCTPACLLITLSVSRRVFFWQICRLKPSSWPFCGSPWMWIAFSFWANLAKKIFPPFFALASPLLVITSWNPRRRASALFICPSVNQIPPFECKMPASLRRTRRLFTTHHPTSPFFAPLPQVFLDFFVLFRPSLFLDHNHIHCAHHSAIKKKKSWKNSLASPPVASVVMYISLKEKDVWEILRNGRS